MEELQRQLGSSSVHYMLCLWLSGDTYVGTYSGMLTANLPPCQEDSAGGLLLQLAFCRPHPPFLASNYTDVTVKFRSTSFSRIIHRACSAYMHAYVQSIKSVRDVAQRMVESVITIKHLI